MRRDFSDATSLGAETRSWQGRGEGARAPTRTFRPPPLPHKVGFVGHTVSCPLTAPGGADGAPREGRGGGEAKRGAPRPRQSPARRVSTVGCRAPGAALRQPSHRGARVPLPGLS